VPNDSSTDPQVTRRIVLVRHARSAHVASPGWVDAAGVDRWREAYDTAGILDESLPPPALVAVAADADCLMTSNLPRALASAERLAPGRVARVSPLLREISLEIPRWVRARWPLTVWEVCIHAHWLVRERRGAIAGAAELQRAADAVALLEDVSREASTVVVVTHGAFRRLLALRLVATGWTAERRVGGYRNWSSWPFSRTTLTGGETAIAQP
jgi:broad specificity phosphatase PhoE